MTPPTSAFNPARMPTAPLLPVESRPVRLLLFAVPLALFVAFLTQVGPVTRGEDRSFAVEWVPLLDVDFTMRLDGLALLFALLIAGIGALIVLYSGAYLHGHHRIGRFYLLLFSFMFSMLGLVLADNLVTLFVFWELTSVSSFGLIGFESEKPAARAASLQALLVTGGGGLALLAGLILLGVVTGTQQISAINESGAALIRESNLYMPISILVFAGAFTKSAQVPFHFWLPNAMEAPTPVSAYLHSATMVKAGIYLLARLNPSLGGSDLWTLSLLVFGGLTMLIGAVMALRETDLKRILAYLTLSILGSLVLMIGIGTEAALLAAMVLLVGHALYKAALFMIAGIVDHETGTRSLDELGGLARKMPIVAAIAAVAAASMAGVLPLFGFIAKEAVYEAAQEAIDLPLLLTIAVITAGVSTAAAALILTVGPFFGPVKDAPKHPHGAPAALLAGPIVLAALSVLLGLVPGLGESLLVASTSAALGENSDARVYLWHGVNLTLLLSFVTLALGVAVYTSLGPLRTFLRSRRQLASLSPGNAYEVFLRGLNRGAVLQTRLLQHGYLRFYVAAIVLCLAAFPAAVLLLKDGLAFPSSTLSIRMVDVVVTMTILAGALVAVSARTRLTAVMALGMVGYGMALTYVVFGAPDLAITQVLIETLTVMLFVFAFHQLPRFTSLSSAGSRVRDALIAGGAGVVVCVLMLAGLSAERDSTVSDAIAAASKPIAHGSNVVNVILVDFRALDTLGEISVLAVAGLGVISLLAGLHRREPVEASSLLLRPAARLLVPLQIAFSLFLLWRGHNEPGGGFIAGLLVAAAVGLHSIAFTLDDARRLLRLPPLYFSGMGLLVALVAGFIGMVAGDPFLTGKWVEIDAGVLTLDLGTPLLFDTGVYLLVTGTATAILFSLMARSTDDGGP